MQIRYIGSILASAAVFAFSPILLAQTPARARSGAARVTPDLSGVCERPGAAQESPAGTEDAQVERRRGSLPRQAFSMEQSPMQPWAAAKYSQLREGRRDIYQSGRDDIDPTRSCFPPGMPRIYTPPVLSRSISSRT